MPGIGPKAGRTFESALLLWRSNRFKRHVTLRARPDLEIFGSPYGQWVIPTGLLSSESVCYLIGVGTDISFDRALIARFGCEVHSFDPVPAAQEYATAAAADEPRFHFHPYGIWSEDTELRFHRPVVDGYVSHSATDMHHTAPAFSASARSLRSVMDELGHDHIDLLKISAEGSEYRILESVRAAHIPVEVIAVEFAQPAAAGAAERAYDELVGQGGYDAVYVQSTPRIRKVTFVRRDT
jgi:FkbM family methyltransferase